MRHLLLAMTCVLMLAGCDTGPNPKYDTARAAAKPGGLRKFPSHGSVVFFNTGKEGVRSTAWVREGYRFDGDYLEKEVASGRVVMIPNQTAAEVVRMPVEMESGDCRIKILEGPHKGKILHTYPRHIYW